MVFALNGFLFILGALEPWQQGKVLLGSIQLIAGGLNLALLPAFLSPKTKQWLNQLVLLMNVAVAISIAWDQIAAGKRFIQYAWLLAAFASLVALLVQLKKDQTASVGTSEIQDQEDSVSLLDTKP